MGVRGGIGCVGDGAAGGGVDSTTEDVDVVAGAGFAAIGGSAG